jgi:hypothetical protein
MAHATRPEAFEMLDGGVEQLPIRIRHAGHRNGWPGNGKLGAVSSRGLKVADPMQPRKHGFGLPE